MTEIKIDRQSRETIARRLVRTLKDEFDLDLAPMDAQRFVNVLSETVGPYYYNQGLYDAQAVLEDRAEAISDAIASLEKPAPR